MCSLVVKNPDEHIWDFHREVLEEKYVKDARPLQRVMTYMEEEHGFVAKKNQYEKYLIQKWKLRKYTDSSKWKAASPLIRRLQREGQPFELWIDGKKKSASIIRKELKRHAASSEVGQSPMMCELPRGVIFRKLTPSSAPSSTIELPFYCFENLVLTQCLNTSPWTQKETNNCMSEDDFGSLTTWGLDRSNQKALNAVMLVKSATNYHLDSLTMTPHSAFCTSPLYRRILFSFANNFAGIGALPKEVFGYLQSNTSEDLYRILGSTPEYYTTQAIAHNLFQASIEIGNSQMVDFLLKESFPGVQVHSVIPSYNGSYSTPIERAAALMHTEVVRVLLAYGADVNDSRPRDIVFPRSYGALAYLIRSLDHHSPEMVDQIDSDLFSVLLNVGGKVDDDALAYLIRNDRKGKALEILKLMITNNVDLNHQVQTRRYDILCSPAFDDVREHDRLAKTLIDEVVLCGDLVQAETLLDCGARLTADTLSCAIESGNEDLVETLLDHGARLTADTLPCAIESGNEDLVKRLFKHGAKTDSKGWSGQSALAAAISVQNPKMVELVEGQKGVGFLEDPEHLQVAMKAASEVGNISWIERLAKKGGVINPEDLGHGLTKAVHEGKDDVALALLNFGAGTDCWNKGRPPLAEALQRGNAVLVFALLDAGADPNYYVDNISLNSTIELAVKCGDLDVVRAIIEAGAHFKPYRARAVDCRALSLAIECRNKELATMLLHARYDVNHVPNSDGTALAAAVKTGDLDLVHFVMEWGADPHDRDALHFAWNQNSAAFDLVLEKHAARYPKGRKGWGAELLKEAILRDDYKSFQQLLERGADANCPLEIQNTGGDPVPRQTTLFGYAISESNNPHIRFADFLLQHQRISGCTPEIVGSWVEDEALFDKHCTVQFTAFLAAIETGDAPTIELFLRHDANVNFPARYRIKRTPLQRAAEIGNMDVVELLLKRGADPNGPAGYESGGTAIQLASKGGYLGIVELLLEHGADVNASASKVDGRTPLEGAAEHGRLDMVAFLLEAGAGQSGKDKKDFDRAIARAEEKGYFYIANLLKRYFATGKLSASQPLFEEFLDPDMFD